MSTTALMPVSNKRTDPEKEQQVVTLIARGDRYADISEVTGVPVPTIKKIKRRNGEALIAMRTRIVEWQAKTAARTLQKSLRLIERRLDRALIGEEEISLRDLVRISKEMFNQGQIEQGKPTAIIEDPREVRERLEQLLTAINSNDMVALEQIVFRATDTS